MSGNSTTTASNNFIKEIVERDAAAGMSIAMRFPPEPNGYLHIGHIKAIVLNFELAAQFGGTCYLRMDDTNPDKESQEYIDAIQADIRWLGYAWDGEVRYTSDYFGRLYDYACLLIDKGLAYVDFSSFDTVQQQRGTPTEAGVDSQYRERAIADNRADFAKMRDGGYAEGECVLRAKIDMGHANLYMRDPVLYRVKKQAHHRTGAQWNIYPLYDFAHGQSDAIEGITHSLCTLEFENHRPLYEWFLDALEIERQPRQIEFARLNLSHTVLSKRVLHELVTSGAVNGWDDPRMPTVSGMRRRGYPPQAVCNFCRDVGITKVETMIDSAHLEYFVREYLNAVAVRVMVVLDPVEVIIDNYPAEKTEMVEAINNPEDAAAGSRMVPFSRRLYIDASDFMVEPPKKYFRLAPGAEVRLKHAYYVTCTDVTYRADGTIATIHCSYDPHSRGGDTPDKRKVKGTIQWVSAAPAVRLQVRQYGKLFGDADVAERIKQGESVSELIDSSSVEVIDTAVAEPSVLEMVGASGTDGASSDDSIGDSVTSDAQPLYFQFMRCGYFVYDYRASAESGVPVFNRTVALRDSWQKIVQKEQ